jgi:hypothetical protein
MKLMLSVVPCLLPLLVAICLIAMGIASIFVNTAAMVGAPFVWCVLLFDLPHILLGLGIVAAVALRSVSQVISQRPACWLQARSVGIT